MSKRSKKKNRKKMFYTKKEFGNIFCTECVLCAPNTPPDFCHEIYRKAPKNFLTDCYPQLKTLSNAIFTSPERYNLEDINEDIFKDIFCNAYLCYNDVEDTEKCTFLKKCYETFCEQIGLLHDPSIYGPDEDTAEAIEQRRLSKKERRKIRKQYESKKKVVLPYPTFFSRDNEEFQQRIRQILYGNEDTNRKQDTNKELSEGCKGDIALEASNSESGISGSCEPGQEYLADIPVPFLL